MRRVATAEEGSTATIQVLWWSYAAILVVSNLGALLFPESAFSHQPTSSMNAVGLEYRLRELVEVVAVHTRWVGAAVLPLFFRGVASVPAEILSSLLVTGAVTRALIFCRDVLRFGARN